MIDDKLNEDSEEEKKDDQPDESFGLPDLEFDDLQELDFNLEDNPTDEGSVFESEDPNKNILSDVGDSDSSEQLDDFDTMGESSVLDEGLGEVEDVLDSVQLISDRLGGDDSDDSLFLDDYASEETGFDDIIVNSPNLADEPTSSFGGLNDIGLDLSPQDSVDDSSEKTSHRVFGENESVDSDHETLFSVEDAAGDDNSSESIFAADDLSTTAELPSFDGVDESASLPNYKPYDEEESQGGFVKVILIGLLLVFILGGTFYYFSLSDPEEKSIAENKLAKEGTKKPVERKKLTDKEEDEKPASGKEVVPVTDKTNKATERTKKPKAQKKVQQSKKKLAVKKPVKTVATATAPTGKITMVTKRSAKSYVIIGSFASEKRAMSYAKKLSNTGKGVKIIYPYDKMKRYRVSIADYGSFGDAASHLSNYRAKYGKQVWALTY